jgi:hypothetical protein
VVQLIMKFSTEVEILPWPARSPELNLIEHVWDNMDRCLRRFPQQANSHLQQAWNEITDRSYYSEHAPAS